PADEPSEAQQVTPAQTGSSASPVPTAAAPPPLMTAPIGDGSLNSLERILAEQNRMVTHLISQQTELLRHAMGGAVSSNVASSTPVSVPQNARQSEPTPAGSRPAMPWGRAAERQSSGLSEVQKRHLDSLIERYTARTRKSKELAASSRRVLA